MNRLGIRTLIRKKLGESTAAFWTDVELNTWIDDGCDDLAFRAKCIKTNGKMTTVTSTMEYALSTYYPNLLSITEVYYYLDGSTWDKLEPTNRTELDEEEPGWKSAASGTPDRYYWDKEADVLGFYVKPNATNAGTNYAEVYYNKKHIDITDDTSTIDIPEPLHNAIIDYVVAIGLDTRGWGDRANDAWQKYFSKIRDYQIERSREREDDDLIMKNYRNI